MAGAVNHREPGRGRRAERRRYDSPVRRQQVAETRERILGAASALVHGFPTWDWRALTFRAVAERAGVSERTVYRHFATERELRDAVMRRLEEEAGVAYEGVGLDDLADVAALVFSSLSSFAVSPPVVDDPTFVAEDQLRRDALRDAVDRGGGRLDRRRAPDGGRPPRRALERAFVRAPRRAVGALRPTTRPARSRGRSGCSCGAIRAGSSPRRT